MEEEKQNKYCYQQEEWEIQRIIERTVKDRLDNLLKEKTKEITAKIQDMVLEEMLKE